MGIIEDFMNAYNRDVVQMCIRFRQDNGPGVLIIDLNSWKPKAKDLDAEYYALKDIPAPFFALKNKIIHNPRQASTIYVLVVFRDKSQLFEKDLRTGGEK